MRGQGGGAPDLGRGSPWSVRGYSIRALSHQFSLVAMQAGCVRAFESLRVVDAAAVPPPPAAALLVAGAAPAPPPLAVAQAPVVQALTVSAGGESNADMLGDNA